MKYRQGKVWVGEAGLYAEERAELVQKMAKAPLVDGSRGFAALSDRRAGEAGRRWCRWGTA